MERDNKPLIGLKFSDNDFNDFYAYCLETTEGISMPYKADVTVLTVESHSRKELKNLLKKPVSVSIRQKFDNKKSCTRYLKGIVTSFQDKGVIFTDKVSATGRKNCSRYVITIEPPLSLASFGKRTRTFKGKTPLEIVKEIGEEYNIQFEDFIKDKPDYYNSKDVVFQQRNESDLSFLNRLFLAYGLNYYFYHDEKGFEPQIRLTNEKNFKPSSKISYSSGETVPEKFFCDVTSSGGNSSLPGLSRWEFSQKLGNSGLNYQDCGIGSIFEYDRRMGRGAEVITETRIKKNIDTALKYSGAYWTGESGHIALVPGTYLEVSGISLSPEEKLSCVLRETSLYYESVWPSYMAIPPAITEDKASVRNMLKALEFDPGEKDETGDSGFSLSSIISEGEKAAAVPNLANSGASENFLLAAATVSDRNGETSDEGATAVCDEIDKNNPMRFYAVIDFSEKSAVIANLVIPVGGASSGMYYFPKIGDRVLLTCFQGKYYLFGYLSDTNEFGDFHTGIRDDMVGSTILRRGFSDGSSSEKNKIHEIKMSDGGQDNIKSLIMYGSIDAFANRTITEYNDPFMRRRYESEPSFILDGKTMPLRDACKEIRSKVSKKLTEVKNKMAAHNDKCKIYSEAAEADKEKAAQDMNKSAAELEKARKELDDTNNILATVAQNVRKALEVEDGEKQPSIGISTDGNANITARQELNETADKYTLTALKGIQMSSEEGTINISSKKSISLTVGTSSITLSPNGIVIRSRKWAHTSGPFDSTIFLDSVSGTTLWGMNIALKAALGVNIADTLGASLGAAGGNAIVKGNTVAISTNDGRTALANVANAASQLLSQCISVSQQVSTEGTEMAKRTGDLFMNIWNSGFTLNTTVERFRKTNAGNVKAEIMANGLIPQVLNIIASVIDSSVFYLEAKKDPFITKTYPNGMSGRDILRLTSTVAKITSISLGMTGLIKKMSLFEASSLALTKGYTLSTAEQKISAKQNASAVGPVAGTSLNGPNEEETDLDIQLDTLLSEQDNQNNTNFESGTPSRQPSNASNRPSSSASGIEMSVDGPSNTPSRAPSNASNSNAAGNNNTNNSFSSASGENNPWKSTQSNASSKPQTENSKPGGQTTGNNKTNKKLFETKMDKKGNKYTDV